ncbi:hypothetical protein B296_00036529 [Ensete ventricosum]|uniref:Uncharacterized protein n=1 Tax=Ensete ventricosum TaxID=4639 RepID=A0A426Y7M8_ENSVE|nr:hypothetical protein B296_00036529 [Ensete ventricosum]
MYARPRSAHRGRRSSTTSATGTRTYSGSRPPAPSISTCWGTPSQPTRSTWSTCSGPGSTTSPRETLHRPPRRPPRPGHLQRGRQRMSSLALGSVVVRSYAFRIVAGEIGRGLLPLLFSIADQGDGAVVDLQDVFRWHRCDAKAVDNCYRYLEVWEQDARATGDGCCYRAAWEQDAKMVGYHKSRNCVATGEQVSEGERAAIEGEGRGYVAAVVVAVGRKKRQRSNCRLEGAEPEIRSNDSSRGQRQVMGASGCFPLLSWLKGTLDCEGAPRIAVGEDALAVGREVSGGGMCCRLTADQWRAEPESSDPQTVVAMLYFIVKQRSQLEKTISGYDFVERG